MDDETEASKISIHALREEGDLVRLCRKAPVPNFYPRPPRGGRLKRCTVWHGSITISIHALREEGDLDLPENAPGYS